MRLFIDTNIYLSLIEFKNEKISSFEKLKKLVETKKIVLIFPRITQNEFYRQVETIRRDIFKLLVAPNAVQLASINREGTLASELDKAYSSYSSKVKELQKEYTVAVEKLKKDINSLIKNSVVPDENNTISSRAHSRRLKGYPPGKKTDPIGDEVAWELFLENYKDDDLVIVSNDYDWRNYNGRKEINGFLKEEWESKAKNKKIRLFTQLFEFLQFFDNKISISKHDKDAEVSASDFASKFANWQNEISKYNLNFINQFANSIKVPSMIDADKIQELNALLGNMTVDNSSKLSKDNKKKRKRN